MNKRIEELKEIVNKEIVSSKTQSAVVSLLTIKDEIDRILSPYIYIVRLGHQQYLNIDSKNYIEYDAVSSTIFELEQDAINSISRLKETTDYTIFELITIPKNNFNIDDVLVGYCNGYFDGNYNSNKRIIGVNGYQITVQIEDNEQDVFTEDFTPMQRFFPIMVAQWKKEI